jgi:type II secretory ATPase GspE/PulE/Tfp pilus assembly ATPase PilB-like protein
MAVLRKEIGDLLVDNGVITDDELESARLERQRTGESIVGILSRQGLANESHLKNALELQYGVNFVALIKSKTPPEPDAVALLPEEVMRLHQLVCIYQQADRITVAMADPSDVSACDDLKSRLPGMQFKMVVCLEDEIEEFLNVFFAKGKTLAAAEPAAAKAAERPMSLLERITASQRKSALNETAEIPRSAPEPPTVQESHESLLSKAAENFAAANTPSETIAAVTVEAPERAEAIPEREVAAKGETAEHQGAAPPEPAPRPTVTENQRILQAQHQASKSPTLMGMAAMVIDESETELAKRAQEEAIVLLANQILSSAIKRHCSNIHISPGEREGSVNYRLDGALYVDRKLPKTILTPIVARYKMMARMNLAERNICQDGHIKVKSSAKEIVCLVSVVPTQYGEHVSIWIV